MSQQFAPLSSPAFALFQHHKGGYVEAGIFDTHGPLPSPSPPNWREDSVCNTWDVQFDATWGAGDCGPMIRRALESIVYDSPPMSVPVVCPPEVCGAFA